MTGFLMWFYRPRVCSLLTSGFSEICLAQDRMMRIASMLVSGKPEFDENSDKHFTASWKESIVAEKCSLKIRSIRQEHNKSMIPQSYKKVPTCGQKSKFNNGCITIWSCKVKHGENIFPTRLDLVSFSINHLSQTSNHHVSDSDGPEARVVGIKYAQHNKELQIYSFLFMMCSNGLRKSFWNLKLASSPFSKNFIDNWRRESTTKKATSSLGRQPTWSMKTYVITWITVTLTSLADTYCSLADTD